MGEKDIYRVLIEKLDHYGRGIARLNGKIVFVPMSLPSEVVDAKIEKEKKKYIEASLVRIEKSSLDRIQSICPYFGKCGGCDLLHLSYPKQLTFKEDKVKEILSRFGMVDTSLIKPILSSENHTFYRNKARFKVKESIGYYGKKSYELIPIHCFFIVNEKINEILNHLNHVPYLSSLKEVIIRVSSLGESMVILSLLEKIPFTDSPLESLVTTIVTEKEGTYKILTRKGYIEDQIGEYRFNISPSAFFQIHPYATKLLYDTVYKYANVEGGEVVLDLYCGTGTLGIYVSDRAGKIIGLEKNKEAIKDARRNAALNGVKNAEFRVCDLTHFQKTDFIKEKIDVVIVDPPRAGLEGDALTFLLDKKIDKLIYVSCDPMTLARDLKTLQSVYEIMEVTPVDMFPNTYHVETVVMLSHKNLPA